MIRLQKGTPIGPEQIKTLIERHKREYVPRYIYLDKLYRSKHKVLKRTKCNKDVPCNKLVTNHCRYITNIATGYFMGTPVKYTSTQNGYVDALKSVYDDNFEEDTNAEHAKTASIKGESYELLWLDENAQIKFKDLPVEETILIYGYEISDFFWAAIHYYKTGSSETAVVYTDHDITTYTRQLDKDKKPTEFARQGEPEPHYFGDVPIVAYINNKEREGDYECIISLNDAYNSGQSDTADELDYFSDAYLVISGMNAEENDIKRMKEDRVLILDENGKAFFLTKQGDDTTDENFKARLQKDIHAISMVPRLTDENFTGSIAGVALRFKLWGLEELASTKQRKFTTAFLKRAELITNIINIKRNTSYDYRDLDITFTRNIPQNALEWAEIVSKVSGTVSHKTQLKALPFVDDPEAEMVQIKKEQDDSGADGYGDFFGSAPPPPGDTNGQPTE